MNGLWEEPNRARMAKFARMVWFGCGLSTFWHACVAGLRNQQGFVEAHHGFQDH